MLVLKTLVHSGCSTPSIGTVNNIVVDERRGLKQFNGRPYAHHRQGLWALKNTHPTCAAPSPVAQ